MSTQTMRGPRRHRMTAADYEHELDQRQVNRAREAVADMRMADFAWSDARNRLVAATKRLRDAGATYAAIAAVTDMPLETARRYTKQGEN